MRNASRHRQGGAVILTVCMLLLCLLGFIGIALDFGRLFVVKTELQTAMDSCALSAAQELDGLGDSINRANSAGVTASNLNRVNFQSPTWSGQGTVTVADITFRDASYNVTVSPTVARYAQCQHTQPNIQMWLLDAMGAFSGNTALYPGTRNVWANAVATRASAQTTCPVPLMMKPKATGVAPNYGYAVGEWVLLLMGQNVATGGQIGWANLDGSNGASETQAEMEGHCGTEVGDTLGTPGVQTAIADAWNYRFGIYKNGVSPAVKRPDFTGYAYTSTNWPVGSDPAQPTVRCCAYNGNTPPGAPATAANFITKRAAYASCADTGTSVRGANSCESITGLSLNSFQNLANPGAAATDGHRVYGQNRRLVVVPVVDGASRVVDYACMFMLQPLTVPMSDVYLEYRGNAGSSGSPCTTAGLPGGSAGPLVPVLVR